MLEENKTKHKGAPKKVVATKKQVTPLKSRFVNTWHRFSSESLQ